MSLILRDEKLKTISVIYQCSFVWLWAMEIAKNSTNWEIKCKRVEWVWWWVRKWFGSWLIMRFHTLSIKKIELVCFVFSAINVMMSPTLKTLFCINKRETWERWGLLNNNDKMIYLVNFSKCQYYQFYWFFNAHLRPQLDIKWIESNLESLSWRRSECYYTLLNTLYIHTPLFPLIRSLSQGRHILCQFY